MNKMKEKLMEWSDLKIVLAISRSGSLSGAAHLLSLNHSTVFRRINALEKNMGVRFFERLPNGYVLTEAGEAAMRVAERVELEMQTLTREIAGKDLSLQGTIHVTAPAGISLTLLRSHLARFCRLHPDIHINLIATSFTLELSRREADLAVRVTNTPPDTSIGRQVCDFKSAVYGAKKLFWNQKTQDLDSYDWCITEDQMDWLPSTLLKRKKQSGLKTVFSSNNVLAVMNAVKEGMGVATLPCFLGDQEKSLVRITRPLEELTSQLWVLTHSDLRNTARVRTLLTFLYDSLKKQKDLFEGK
jgi:DNA-binding transcriptional LysR family regulator